VAALTLFERDSKSKIGDWQLHKKKENATGNLKAAAERETAAV
jgi:hypothetical protein